MALISNRINKMRPSATIAVAEKIRELKNKDIDVISLSSGEPFFYTADNIKNAAIDAIHNNKTLYTDTSGIIELRQAICNKFSKEYGAVYNSNEVIVSSGAKQSLFNIFFALLNSEDEVIIPAPYWVSYPEMVTLAGGNYKLLLTKPDNNFKLTAEELDNAISAKTKAIIFNSPNNPTGVIYSQEELENIVQILLKHPHVIVITDDIYEKTVFSDKKYYSFAHFQNILQDRLVVVNGVSKTYAMTGWRIGYALTKNSSIIKAMKTIQSQTTSCPCSISQYAALEAIRTNDDNIHHENSKNVKINCDAAIDIFSQIKNLNIVVPDGGFFIFLGCEYFINSTTSKGVLIENTIDLVNYLLDSVRVAVVSGDAFGIKGYIRISCSVKKNDIINGANLIVQALSKLNKSHSL